MKSLPTDSEIKDLIRGGYPATPSTGALGLLNMKSLPAGSEIKDLIRGGDPGDSFNKLALVVNALFGIANLIYSPLMASAVELGLHPDIEDMVDERSAEEIGRQTKDIRIVVTSAKLGRHVVMSGGCPDARVFIGRDAHANAGATDEHATLGTPCLNLSAELLRKVGVVDAFFAFRSEVTNLVVTVLQVFDHSPFDLKTTVIRRDRNPHGNILLVAHPKLFVVDASSNSKVAAASKIRKYTEK